MALIKLGPIIADARGGLGGQVFSRNRYGAYSRNRTKPVYPASEKQVARAALMNVLVDLWKNTLTTPKRNKWNELATITSFPNRLGEQFRPSGFNLYIHSNFMLSLTGQTLVVAPPVSATAPAPTLTLAWTTLVGVECTNINGWDNTACDKLLAQKSPDLPPSINFYKGPWALTWAQNGVYYNVLPALITPSAQLTANTRVYYRFRSVHANGAISHAAVYSADVGTPA